MIYTKRLSDIRRTDRFQAGWKAAILGELMTRFPIPQGFCITVSGYRHLLEEPGPKIHALLDGMDDPSSVQKGSDAIAKMFRKSAFPRELEKEIVSRLECHARVAVRPSPTIEGVESEEPFISSPRLGIVGKKAVLAAIASCFASLYSPQAIMFRESRHFIHREAFMAVIVQDMVDCAYAGKVFTIDPVNRKFVLIEVVQEMERPKSHAILPNTYFLDRATGQAHDMSERFIFDHAVLEKVYRMAIQAERHLGAPQEVSFGIDAEGKAWIFGSRSISGAAQ